MLGWFRSRNAKRDGSSMADRGALPLRRYSNGGIAITPQLAMYGEGRLLEAYVPLGDGRTTPVSLQLPAPGAPASIGSSHSIVSSPTINVSVNGSARPPRLEPRPRREDRQAPEVSSGGNCGAGAAPANATGRHVETIFDLIRPQAPLSFTQRLIRQWRIQTRETRPRAQLK